MAKLPHIKTIIKKHKRYDIFFSVLGFLVIVLSLMTLLVLFVDLLHDGLSRLSLDFLTSFPSRRAHQAGILSAAVGSLLVILITFVTAVPLGILSALYLEEYAPKSLLSEIIEINILNLAGVPSIIYGLLALGLFVYGLNLGPSIVTAGLTLGLLILPTIIVATRESLRMVPVVIREAAFALGATKWQVVKDHVLRYAYGGILTGIILGISRALGETAPLLTIGALTFIAFLPPTPITSIPPFINFEWLFSGFTVLPIQMFNWVSRPDHAFHANAAATGILIILLTLLMNAVAIYLRYKTRKNIQW